MYEFDGFVSICKDFLLFFFGNSQYGLLFSVNLHSLKVKYLAFKHEYYCFLLSPSFLSCYLSPIDWYPMMNSSYFVSLPRF
jgi:hypothetical protein